jgi:hypothetical protein
MHAESRQLQYRHLAEAHCILGWAHFLLRQGLRYLAWKSSESVTQQFFHTLTTYCMALPPPASGFVCMCQMFLGFDTCGACRSRFAAAFAAKIPHSNGANRNLQFKASSGKSEFVAVNLPTAAHDMGFVWSGTHRPSDVQATKAAHDSTCSPLCVLYAHQ